MSKKPFQPAPDDETDPFDLRYRDEPPPETSPETPSGSEETVRSFNLLQEIRERLQRLESGVQTPATDLSGQSGELITSLKADRDRANELLTEARRELGKQEEKCRSLRKQVDFVQKKYLERNKRVQGLKAELGEARQQAEAALAELRQQLAERHPSEELQAELEQARQRCADLEREFADQSAAQEAQQQKVPADEVSEALRAELEEARQEQDKREQTCRDLEAQLFAAQNECRQRDERIAELQTAAAAREEAETRLAALQSELDARQQAREAAEARLAEAQGRCDQHRQRIEELTAAMEEHRARSESDLAEAKRQLDEHRQQSEADLAEARRQWDEYRQRSEADLAEARRQLDEYRQQSEADLVEARHQLDEYRQQSEAELVEVRRQLAAQREQAESDLADARRQLAEQQQAREQLDQQLSEARELCRQSEDLLTEARAKLEEQRRRAEADLAAAERLAEEQQEACQAFEAQLAEARRQREAAQQRTAELTETLEEERRRAEADLAASRSRLEQQENECRTLQGALAEREQQAEQLERALAEARDALTRERETVLRQLDKHKAEEQVLREGLAKAEQGLVQLQERATELEETLNRERQTATVEIETLAQDLERQRGACQGLHEQLAEARRLGEGQDRKIAELEDALTRQREEGETALTLAEQEVARQQERCESLTRELDSAGQKGRELQQQVTELNEVIQNERETARSALSEARQQLQHQQHQVQSLHARLLEAKQHDESREQQISELKQALSEAADRIVGMDAQPSEAGAGVLMSPPSPQHGWPRTAKVALAAAVVLGLISAGVTTWFYEFGPGRPTYRIAGLVSVPSADTEFLDMCKVMADREADREKAVRTAVDRDRGVIELSVRTDNPETGIALVNRLGEKIAAEALRSLQGPADTQPAVSEEYQRRREQLAELDQQLAAIANRPATIATEDASRLLATWQQLRAEQKKVAEALAEIAPRLNPPTVAETTVQVDDEEYARAQAANQQLQADTEALQQREQQLTSRLRTAVGAGLVQFEHVDEAIAATSKQVDTEIETDHPPELDHSLKTMQGALATWSKAVDAAREVWETQKASFQSENVDPLVAQDALERAARAFIGETAKAAASFEQALEALGQGEGQVTRRLVLRNALAKQYSTLTDAQSGALAAARAVVIAEDVELVSIVQRLTGLRQRVERLQHQTAEAVRQQKLTDLQNRREQDQSQARAEYDRLTAAAAELDEALLKTAEQAVQMVTEGSTQHSALMEQADLLRRRTEAMKKLMELQGSPAGEASGRGGLPPVRFIPARAGIASGEASTDRRLRNALLAGSAPLLAFVIITGVAALIGSSRRSSRSMEDYARCLIEAAQQSHDPASKPSADAPETGE